MKPYIIVTGKNTPILRKKSTVVMTISEDVLNIIKRMKKTLQGTEGKESYGIGLAANQVGIDKRIILVTFGLDKGKNLKTIPMINPEIIEESEKKVKMEEGCLSLPDESGKVLRSTTVKVSWMNEKGNRCIKKLKGWDARVFLHEYDHIEGILFIDRI